MKRKITAAILTLSILLAACGGSSGGSSSGGTGTAVASASVSSSSVTETAESSAPAEADLSNPEIVVEFGDFEGIQALMKQMGNFEVAEGTVIRITGLYYHQTSTPSIMEENEAGDTRLGLNMYLEEGIEEPAEKTKVEATGTAVKGQYAMEFHVSADGFVVLD